MNELQALRFIEVDKVDKYLKIQQHQSDAIPVEFYDCLVQLFMHIPVFLGAATQWRDWLARALSKTRQSGSAIGEGKGRVCYINWNQAPVTACDIFTRRWS